MALSLQDLEAVNRAWGNADVLARGLEEELAASPAPRSIILDVGAGSGGVSRDLAARLRGAGASVCVIAVDLQWRHLASGRGRAGPIPAVAADGFALPFADGSAAWVVSTLLFHHFSARENVRLLRELGRVARRGFRLLDISRHVFPLLFIRLAGRFAFRTRVSLEDGIASVRQAYTLEEAAAIAREAVPGTRVRRVFPFRFLIDWSR